ncbi:hypothetical protein ACJ41O_012071 [Fusarium nematophilum]
MAIMRPIFLASGLLALLCAANVAIQPGAGPTCVAVKNYTAVEIVYPNDQSFQEERLEYWSTAAAARRPSCILLPSNTDEVGAILSILSRNNERFAIKAGGYNGNENFSSIDNKPLISLSRLNHINLNPESGIVQVGPGARWGEVAEKLDPANWTLPGARFGNVGVGGYLLGNGLSFFTQQRGWGSSSVTAVQIALPNGTITIASDSYNSELFLALKGGGNNLGIVTSFHMTAREQSAVWGGTMTFDSNSTTDLRLLEGLRDFTAYNEDQRAALMLTARYAANKKLHEWTLFLFYAAPESDMEKRTKTVFDRFKEIGPFEYTCKDRAYADLLKANDGLTPRGKAVRVGTETLPNPGFPYVKELLGSIYADWRRAAEETSHLPGSVAEISFSPLPFRFWERSQTYSADLLQLVPERRLETDRMKLVAEDKWDQVLVEIMFGWEGHEARNLAETRPYNNQTGLVDRALNRTLEQITLTVSRMANDGKVEQRLRPIFMNGAGENQDYFGRLHFEMQRNMSYLLNELDSDGVMTRTGGFKVPVLDY